jgi:hypothetical protein
MSDVTAGAVLTLVIPLAMLVVVLGLWALGRRWLASASDPAGEPEPPQER